MSVISFELATDNAFVVLVLNTDNRPIMKQKKIVESVHEYNLADFTEKPVIVS